MRVAALAIVASLAMPALVHTAPATDEATAEGVDIAPIYRVYFGKSRGDSARVRLTRGPHDTAARIRLAARPAARAAEHLVALHCGSGGYGREALVTLRWPSRKRVIEVGTGTVVGGVDRCRVSSRHRFSIRMRMRGLS